MKQYLAASLLLLLSFPAVAEQQSSFIYTKTIIKIVPKAAVQTTEPAAATDKKGADAADPSGMMPTLRRAPKEFTVEVRTAAFLQQKDFISHQPFTDREGLLILIDPPAEAELVATRMIAAADVLFVDADGYIIKIAPELKLAGLTEAIGSGRPVHAFVYLKSGTASASDIEIGDRIENTYFKTHPVVIE
jgi:uncharacterized membrane protein (UPF0127 family)